MAYYEKPKRTPEKDDDKAAVLRQFYWQLFVHLMVPACLLAFILSVPVIIVHNLPDRLSAQCSVFDATNPELGVRIISETQRTNTTNYYVTHTGGDSWSLLHSLDRPYQSARADCDTVVFNSDAQSAAVNLGDVYILVVDFFPTIQETVIDFSDTCVRLEDTTPTLDDALADFSATCVTNDSVYYPTMLFSGSD